MQVIVIGHPDQKTMVEAIERIAKSESQILIIQDRSIEPPIPEPLKIKAPVILDEPLEVCHIEKPNRNKHFKTNMPKLSGTQKGNHRLKPFKTRYNQRKRK